MKKLLFLLLLLPALTWAQNEKPFVVPEMQQWRGAKGTLPKADLRRVVYADGSYAAAADYLARTLSIGTAPGTKAQKGDILITRAGLKATHPEAYSLDIRKDRITVRVNAAAGALWAAQSLLQIAQTCRDTFPQGYALDEPDYRLRGFMIDCGRKYIPMDYLRSLVRCMAYYKMNTLQVHLNDNGFKKYHHDSWQETQAAFRLESDNFPGLTAIDGSYTKDEFREFCKWSQQQGVEIIPEIDVPAHALAFTHFRPQLACEEFGADHLDLTNPTVGPFIDSLFTEYIAGPDPVFAGPRVHIGTDEYSNKKKEVVELFRSLTDHLIKLMERHGKQAVVWGSLSYAHGETPIKVENVIMDMWSNGFAKPQEMKELGYQMVSIPDGWVYIVPRAGYYYDYLNCQMLYEHWTPANINGVVFPEKDPQIEGGMFALWNDVTTNGISVGDIHHRILPALQIMAHKTWFAKNDSVGYSEWDAHRKALSDAPGVDEIGRAELNIVDLRPNTALGQGELQIGYPYTVDFDITWADEPRGTILTQSNRAEFYLSDPIRGMLGFSRDGYLYTFNYRGTPHKSEHITIAGTNRETSLFVNGALIQTLGTDQQLAADKKPYDKVQTLVFPLTRTGNYKSEVRHLVSHRVD